MVITARHDGTGGRRRQVARCVVGQAWVMLLALLLMACGGGPAGGAAPPAPAPPPQNLQVAPGGGDRPGCGQFEQCTDEGELQQAPPDSAAPTSQVDPSNPYPYTVEQYLDYIIGDLDHEWSPWFVQNGFAEPYVSIAKIEPGTSVHSQCFAQPVPSDAPNAWYCDEDIGTYKGAPNNGSLLLPVATFQKMWTGDLFGQGSKTVGDFAAAIIVAHEFGHHVQAELKRQFNAASTNGQIADPNPPNKELIADCFAGNWMASAYYTGLLTDTDFDEAVSALVAIGDPAPGGTHGTPPQRRQALLTGYHGLPGVTAAGAPDACIKTYWK